MTDTEKILEEFDEKFGTLLDTLEELYGGNPEEMTTFKEALKAFISTSIAQAIAEERARVVKIIKEMPNQSGYEDGDRIDRDDLVASLDIINKPQ